MAYAGLLAPSIRAIHAAPAILRSTRRPGASGPSTRPATTGSTRNTNRPNDDGDGIPTKVELGNGDSNGNDVPDYLEPEVRDAGSPDAAAPVVASTPERDARVEPEVDAHMKRPGGIAGGAACSLGRTATPSPALLLLLAGMLLRVRRRRTHFERNNRSDLPSP